MEKKLKDKKIAMLVEKGFEQSELELPKKILENHGAQVDIISPQENVVKAWNHGRWGDDFPVDIQLFQAKPENYDLLILPGGVINPDKLRIIPQAIEFIKKFINSDKPIAAICHGPWTLINAEGVKDKTMTSWPSLEIDLTNAGAHWVDKQVVKDGNLITSRKPEDIQAFTEEIINSLS